MTETKNTVLIAEDNIALLNLMAEAMTAEGFEVIKAKDGEEALQKIYQTFPDIVILDYFMPKKNAIEIVKEIKSQALYSNIPLMILTANQDRQLKLKSLNLSIEDFLVKPADMEEIIIRAKTIIKKNKSILDTNPLTKLPGNPSLQEKIEKCILSGKLFAVLYCDINNFNPYIDIYGFEAGDNVIRNTANILVEISTQQDRNSFVAHIGGDDFMIVTDYDKAVEISERIVKTFDTTALAFYNEKDRNQGSIIAKNRKGDTETFALASLSIGVVHNKYKKLKSFAEVSQIGSELKCHAKKFGKSTYIIDRRKD
mgnify:FL=1